MIFRSICTALVAIFISVVLTVSVVRLTSFGKDDTDPENGISGMTLHTDNKTGCQYLSRSMGGITPRLDRDGRHICKAQP